MRLFLIVIGAWWASNMLLFFVLWLGDRQVRRRLKREMIMRQVNEQ